MKAKDVKVGDEVWVKIHRCEGSEMARGYHMNGFALRSCGQEYVNFLKLDDDHPVYPDLLALCRRLRDIAAEDHSTALAELDEAGLEPERCNDGTCHYCQILKDAAALLGSTDKEQ